MECEFAYKFIIIGDSGVGKSCILLQFTHREFDINKENTVGVEYGNRVVEVNNTTVKLQIWDTAGQEQFKSIVRSYYRAVSGALIVYDVTNEKSFQNVKNWIKEARANANPQLVMMLVGNKTDLEGKRVVSKEQGQKFADQVGVMFKEVSALSRHNIDEVFSDTARAITQKIRSGDIDPSNEESGVRKLTDAPKQVKSRQEGRGLSPNSLQRQPNKSGSGGCC